jgi:hypothetical protein
VWLMGSWVVWQEVHSDWSWQVAQLSRSRRAFLPWPSAVQAVLWFLGASRRWQLRQSLPLAAVWQRLQLESIRLWARFFPW